MERDRCFTRPGPEGVSRIVATATGYMLFGVDRSLEFAWLRSVPEGAVTVTYSVDGEQHETTGVGYHDHNWGNVGLMKVVHDWCWSRGHAGPYFGHRVLHHLYQIPHISRSEDVWPS